MLAYTRMVPLSTQPSPGALQLLPPSPNTCSSRDHPVSTSPVRRHTHGMTELQYGSSTGDATIWLPQPIPHRRPRGTEPTGGRDAESGQPPNVQRQVVLRVSNFATHQRQSQVWTVRRRTTHLLFDEAARHGYLLTWDSQSKLQRKGRE